MSARSLETVLETVDRAGEAGSLGDELFDVVALLDREPALRRVLTDPSTEPDARVALVGRVLGERVGPRALEVITTAVRGRWSSGRDLPDGLERAGVTAHVAGADAAGRLDDVEDELFRFGRLVAGDPELRSVLSDRNVANAPKQSLVERLLQGKASDATLALVRQAVTARTKAFEPTLEAFAQIAAQRQERLVATVRVANELTMQERQQLVDALGRKYGRDVHANVIVDSSIIGGVSVEIGDEIIDGTISNRLADARRRIGG